MTLHKNLLDIKSITDNEIEAILTKAQYYSDNKESKKILDGKIIFNMFFENSTRTRTSFEMAAKKLGAQVINWDASTSSIKKDETFMDTIQTLAAMKPDAIIVRHSEYNAPATIAANVDCPVINAGDSFRAHPSQAILDALTIKQAKGKIKGLEIAICGDIAHSRVANSNVELLSRMGANIRLVAPKYWLPEKEKISQNNVTIYDDFDAGIKNADIIMMLRCQKERWKTENSEFGEDYFKTWGLTIKRLDKANPNALIMHPGPINRNVEISDAAADDPYRSLILKQVANGVPARMAILDWAIND